MVTEAGLRAFIETKLASESEILASEHREVENAIIDYLIQENEVLQNQIDDIIENPPITNAFAFKGTKVLGDIGANDFRVVNFDDVGTNNYMVVGSIVSNGNGVLDSEVTYAIKTKTSNSFLLYLGEQGTPVQNVSFDFAIILF